MLKDKLFTLCASSNLLEPNACWNKLKDTCNLSFESYGEFISPLLKKKDSPWSNFWGDIDNNRYYKRSFDYMDIANYNKVGCWNVPYINGTILFKKNKFNDIYKLFDSKIINEDFDMYMCRIIREKYIFMYVSNIEKYGFII